MDSLSAVASSALPRRMRSSARLTVERSRVEAGGLGAATGADKIRFVADVEESGAASDMVGEAEETANRAGVLAVLAGRSGRGRGRGVIFAVTLAALALLEAFAALLLPFCAIFCAGLATASIAGMSKVAESNRLPNHVILVGFIQYSTLFRWSGAPVRCLDYLQFSAELG